MAVTSAKTTNAEPDQSPSGPVSVSDSASQTSSLDDTSDHSLPDHLNLSPVSSPQLELQHLPSSRSEEYRQLFRLPPEEVLVQDFNCALQENFLLQGHMYLFVHYICFYSNLFGFENKKMIHFQEITALRRAKTAGFFPNAIELIAGERKFFFTSFLSRDEAFKLIYDGWLLHGNGAKAITDQQESKSELNSQEIAVVDEATNSKEQVDEFTLIERASEDSETHASGEAEILVTSSPVQNNLEQSSQVVLVTDSVPSKLAKTNFEEKMENIDAPAVPESYTLVAESKFPIKVEEVFDLFFSDDAIEFRKLCHKKCGDKDFTCSPWYHHNEFGHARDVSFQHPIKLYFGKRFGCCKEIQKYRVYKNSHLVVHTSQEISDVPYSDYFRVEGRWDVQYGGDESKDCCILKVYINVAFSKYTVFKGKIVQSTVEECKEAYAIWIDMTHKLLIQKNLEKEEIQASNLTTKVQETSSKLSKNPNEENDLQIIEMLPNIEEMNAVNLSSNENLSGVASVASLVRDSLVKFKFPLSQSSQIPSLVVIIVALIFLVMQISIILLLAKPQQILQVVPPSDRGSGATYETWAFLDKQISHLKEEVMLVENLLEKMQTEHSVLTKKLKDLILIRNKHVP